MREHLWLVQDGEAADPPGKRRWYLRVLNRWGRICGILVIAGAAAAIGIVQNHGGQSPSGQPAGGQSPASPTSVAASNNVSGSGDTNGSTSEIEVDVHGDVRHPGVVTLAQGDRVADAIRAAGGFVHAQDAAVVNQASVLWDGQEVDVPSPVASGGEQVSNAQNAVTNSSTADPATDDLPTADSERIDINTADLATLETLPGVGPKRANAILSYRQTNGPFSSLEQLGNIRGIGPKTLAKWSNLLIFSDSPAPTTTGLSLIHI